MNASTRDFIFSQLDEDCFRMCKAKSIDYASDRDVLDNFKRQGLRLGLSPIQIWAVYFNKHVDSINNAIARDPVQPTCETEPLSGRIIDALTYLKLLSCLVAENDSDKHFKTIVEPFLNVGKDILCPPQS